MREKRKEKTARDEFIEELFAEKAEVEHEKIMDDELFGGKITDDDQSPDGEAEVEHGLDVIEHGRKFSVPVKAAEEFAKAAGKSAGEIIEIYQKGCCFDELMKRFAIAKKDSEAFEKIAAIRGLDKNEMKNEILNVIESAKFEKMTRLIEEANPGMSRETAEELAKFRIGAKKAASGKKMKNEKAEAIRKKLLELDDFMAVHSKEGVEKIDDSIVAEWENGIPLEKAFRTYVLMKENEKLIKEMEELRNLKTKDEQRFYAAQHSAGSAASFLKGAKTDEFIEGLFKEY